MPGAVQNVNRKGALYPLSYRTFRSDDPGRDRTCDLSLVSISQNLKNRNFGPYLYSFYICESDKSKRAVFFTVILLEDILNAILSTVA